MASVISLIIPHLQSWSSKIVLMSDRAHTPAPSLLVLTRLASHVQASDLACMRGTLAHGAASPKFLHARGDAPGSTIMTVMRRRIKRRTRENGGRGRR